VTPAIELGAIRKVALWEYVVRFGFGGAVTVVAGLIAKRYGPSIGGLFLAFPAILPASLTLVKVHDGRREAAEDARGAVLGALALLAFAAVALTLVDWTHPVVTLAAATAAWSIASIILWAVWCGSA
jgi:uncharacterized membrane protein (GlpM family)